MNSSLGKGEGRTPCARVDGTYHKLPKKEGLDAFHILCTATRGEGAAEIFCWMKPAPMFEQSESQKMLEIAGERASGVRSSLVEEKSKLPYCCYPA